MLMWLCMSDPGLIHNQNSRVSLQPYLDLVENDRPYKCAYCNKAYKKSSHLKQHVRYWIPPAMNETIIFLLASDSEVV